ncbi:MAG: chromosome segregation protein SMC [Clostridia bacterium]|nr:chromosome segregation protein SMC [Clostridia bacterium]
MYLKSLEIMGFKSFPDRTLIRFGEGMTAIVGPNGSGKSNISDAIRWVLGEQSSKALRGSKMEDVIFNGSEKRAPQGFAEVTLTIDNSDGRFKLDFDEIAVTRRYYRSGDSDFFINRKPVRLRDIHELFMDTGLGRDGYAMVGQGRIDDILSQKSEDRREIFEEASGISRFRYRKEEAERKLAGTEDNLIRLRDIIGEMETRVEPLAKQAEKAKKFLLIRDELRGLEIDRWMEESDRIREKSAKAAGNLEITRFQLEECRRALDVLYAESESRAEAFRQNEIAVQTLRNGLSEMEARLAELRNAAALLHSEAGHYASNAARSREELNAGASRKAEVEKEIETVRKELAAARAVREETESAIREASARAAELLRSADDLNMRIDALRARESELRGAAALAGSDAAGAEASRAALSERAKDATAAAENTHARILSVEGEIKEKNALKAENETKLSEIMNIINGHGLRIASREKRMNSLTEKVNALRIELDTTRERQRLLAEMEKDFEGYSKGVRLVMRECERGGLSGIYGTVGSLISVDDEYAVAVESVLGGALQNVITENERAAKGAMLYLKRTDAGRATFLPVSTIRPTPLEAKGLSGEPGYIGIASELVSCDKTYKDIVSYLLGRTCVVDHIDSAIAIARKYRHSFRIVTLDGQMVNAGGSMTGGSSVRGAGILSRANELKRLADRLSMLEADCEKESAALAEARREYDLSVYELDAARAEQRTCEDSLLSVQSTLSQLGILKDGLLSEHARLQGEAEACLAKIRESEQSAGELSAAVEKYTAEADGLAEEISRLTVGRLAASETQTSVSDEMQRLQEKLYADSAAENAANAKLSELISLVDLLGEDRTKQEQIIARAEAERDELLARAAEKETEVSAFAATLAEKRSAISEGDAARLEIERARTECDKRLRDKNDEATRLEGLCIRLETVKGAAEEEEKVLSDRLWENYELTIGEAQTMRRPIENMQETVSRISHLKAQKRGLGEVNVNAVEEYEQLRERYDFFCGQRYDVEKARDDLLGVIGEITDEMKTIFADSFKKINENFKETFTEMFGGGYAELSLEDPEDILNCGIEIKAQPPGKSMKAISLLSGGEKAFVAIALHFAILKVRPTTFCVLDEIETALDEANVNRFAHFVREMSSTVQFILITHRRGTMEESDILYGVTQQQGVTRVLTLDMAKAEKEFNIK